MNVHQAERPLVRSFMTKAESNRNCGHAIETGLEADRVTYKPRVYKIPMIRMFLKLTNLRMNGSIKGYIEMYMTEQPVVSVV